jgi:hypothetical protein
MQPLAANVMKGHLETCFAFAIEASAIAVLTR